MIFLVDDRYCSTDELWTRLYLLMNDHKGSLQGCGKGLIFRINCNKTPCFEHCFIDDLRKIRICSMQGCGKEWTFVSVKVDAPVPSEWQAASVDLVRSKRFHMDCKKGVNFCVIRCTGGSICMRPIWKRFYEFIRESMWLAELRHTKVAIRRQYVPVDIWWFSKKSICDVIGYLTPHRVKERDRLSFLFLPVGDVGEVVWAVCIPMLRSVFEGRSTSPIFASQSI